MNAIHQFPAIMTLIAILATGACGTGAAFSAEVAITPSGAEATLEPNDVPEEQWRFLAWVEVEYVPGKRTAMGVRIADANRALEHGDWGADRDPEVAARNAREFIVTSNNGTPVRLREVANIDVVLVFRESALARQLRREGVRANVARIAVAVDEKKSAEAGVDANDLKEVLARLSPDKKHRLEDLRNLTVPGRNGTAVRLGDVAKIDVVLKLRKGTEGEGKKQEGENFGTGGTHDSAAR